MLELLIAVPIVAISVWGVTEIVKIGVNAKENLERIRHGYPTLNGDAKIGSSRERRGTVEHDRYVDMTQERSQGNN